MINAFANLENLEDLEAGPDAVKKRDPNAFTVKAGGAQFIENCSKCRGTGSFVSYTGRHLGQCFACKGKGKLTYTRSPEQRDHARKVAAERKQKKIEQAAKDRAAKVEAFAAAHPAVVAWLSESAPSFEFAASLQVSLHKFGSLTVAQIAAVEKCIEKRSAAKAEAAARVESAPVIECGKIEEAFAAAKASGLKWPKLSLGEFEFKPAKVGGKNEGAIYVTSGEEYLGKITAGKFVCTREGAPRQSEVLAVAADPKAAAVAHGKRTGSCSCCGRELTNEESITLGIGPICARKYGW